MYDLCPTAEFAYNNDEASDTKMTPFIVNHGFHPRTSWEVEVMVDIKNPASKFQMHWMQSLVDFAFEKLQGTRSNMSRYFDEKHLPKPEYKVGD